MRSAAVILLFVVAGGAIWFVRGSSMVSDPGATPGPEGSAVLRAEAGLQAPAVRTLLRVVDAASGTHLRDVRVVQCAEGKTDPDPHPGDAAAGLLAQGSSPLPVDTTGNGSTGTVLWVGAPGYAWERVDVDPSDRGEELCELSRGAALEVEIQGELPEGPSRLRLRTLQWVPQPSDVDAVVTEFASLPDAEFPEGRPTEEQIREVAEHLLASSHARGNVMLGVEARARVTLEGIAPGEYTLGLELGDSRDTALVLAECVVLLEPERTTRAVLFVASAPEADTVPLAGTFFLPPEWETENVALHFEPLDAAGKTERCVDLSWMLPVGDTPGLYRWDAGRVVPGRYRVRCEEPRFRGVVDTGPRGTTEAELEVAAPADVAVKVVNEATGQRVQGLDLFASGEPARWNLSTRTYDVRVPAGDVELRIAQTGYEAIPEDLMSAVYPGDNEITLRVRRSSGVILFLRAGSTPIPWSDPLAIAVEPVAGTGCERHTGACENHGQYLAVSTPGRYRVTIPAVPGYAAVPPFEVDIPEGLLVEHVVQLHSPQ